LASALPTGCSMTSDCLGFTCQTTIPTVNILMQFDAHFQACTLPNTLVIHIQAGSIDFSQTIETNANSQFRIQTPLSGSLLGQTAAVYVIVKNVGFPQPTVFHAEFTLQGCISGLVSNCQPLGPDPIYSLNVNAGDDPCHTADAAASSGTWAGVGSSIGLLGMGAILFCCVRRRKATKEGHTIAEPPLCGQSLKTQWVLVLFIFFFVLISAAWYVYPYEVASQASAQTAYSGKDVYNALIVAMVFWSITIAFTLFWTHAYRTSENGWVLLLRFLVWLFVCFVFFVSFIVACLSGAGKISDITLADHTMKVAILSWVCSFVIFIHHIVTLATDDIHTNWDKTKTTTSSLWSRCAAGCATCCGTRCACCERRRQPPPRSVPI